MKVRWLAAALRDLERIERWLGEQPAATPSTTIRKIRAASRTFESLGDIGRPGLLPATRELVVRNAPYIIVYRRVGPDLHILAVFHAAQDRT